MHITVEHQHIGNQAADEGATIAKRMGAQSIVGVGGGGVLDLGACRAAFPHPSSASAPRPPHQHTPMTHQTIIPTNAAKAVAGLTLARGGCKDYLRVFHQEKELTAERLPVVAVPTTARSVYVGVRDGKSWLIDRSIGS